MFEQGFLRLAPAAEALLLELVASSGDGPLLVATPELPEGALQALQVLDPSRVVLALGREGLSRQLDTLLGAPLYAGAVIIPPFNLEVPEDSFEQPEGWHIRRWFAEEYLIAHTWARLRPGARLVAFVSAGLLSVNQRRETRRALVAHGLRLVARLPSELLWQSDHPVDMHLVLLERGAAGSAKVLAMIDLEDAGELPAADAFEEWLAGRQSPDIAAQPVFVSTEALGDDYRLDPAYHHPAYLELRPPQGYEELLLGDIADIIAGVRVEASDRRTERPEADGTPYVQVRHLRADGTLSDRTYWLAPDVVRPHERKRAMPGDILVSVSGTIGKVVLIGPEYEGGVLYDTSIRRVRLLQQVASPRAVADFLRSEVGQLQLRRLTLGSVIPHLGSSQLAQVRVFQPSPAGAEASPPAQQPASVPSAPVPPAPLTEEQVLAQTLESELRTILVQVGDSSRADWQSAVAEKLRHLASLLVPKPLAERIRREFPAPLAIAYRRYQMAQHNPYEQLDRMINLVEACTYFAFYVLLADYSRAGWRGKVELPKPASDALRARATFDNRIQFIRALTALAREHKLDVFVPRLLDCKLEEDADYFRMNLRNPVAHSAPGSEAYVERLVHQHQGRLHEMLGKLEFLSTYTMCRVRSHYFQGGRWHYQCELYRGEEYDVNLQALPLVDTEQNGRLIKAERNHLVLLSQDFEALDLWPYYQLHFSDATCRESHLCFVKHFTAADRKLHGESVRSGIELELTGFEDHFRPASAGAARAAS